MVILMSCCVMSFPLIVNLFSLSCSLELIQFQFLLDLWHTCCSQSLLKVWKNHSLSFRSSTAFFPSTSKNQNHLVIINLTCIPYTFLTNHGTITFREVIAELKAAGASWIQFDEPTLVMDLDSHQLSAFSKAYAELESSFSGSNVLIETYFADVPLEAYK